MGPHSESAIPDAEKIQGVGVKVAGEVYCEFNLTKTKRANSISNSTPMKKS
jgi:hypothetical protein